MGRTATLGTALLLAFTLITPADVLAQTKDDTLVYAVQSDVQTWDPPNSVLRESIIFGYHVFDHLAARDLKTGKVGPSLAVSWKTVDDTTWEVKLRKGVKFHDGTPFTAQGRQGHLRPRAEPREQAHRPRQPRQDQERRGGGRRDGAVQDGRPLPALRRAAHGAGDAVREGDQGEGPRVAAGQPRRHRPLQAHEVVQEAGALPDAERGLLGTQARLQVRPHPDHPRAGHPDRRADLGGRRHHQGGAARPDGRDQQVRARPGPRPRRSCARRSCSSTRPAARARTPSRTSACGRPRTWPSTSTRSSST